MAEIQEYLDDIKNAVYGKEVRQSIHDSIQAMNEEIEAADVVKLKETVDDIENSLFPLQLSADGKSYETIGEAHVANNLLIKENKQNIEILTGDFITFDPEWESGKIYETDGTIMESSEGEETTEFIELPVGSTITASGTPVDVYSYNISTQAYIGQIADMSDGEVYTVTEKILVRITAGAKATVFIKMPTVKKKVESLEEQTEEIGQNTAENLLLYPYKETTHTENGVTWTVNGDGTVTANGTTTDDNSRMIVMLEVVTDVLEYGQTYTLSGCPSGGSWNTYYLVFDFGNGKTINEYGNSITFTYDDTTATYATVKCIVRNGVTVENITFEPMLEVGSIKHSFTSPLYSRKNLRKDVDSKLPLTGGTLTGNLHCKHIYPTLSNTYDVGNGTWGVVRSVYANRYIIRDGVNNNDYISIYLANQGTTDSNGVGRLTIGNNIPSGTVGNACGNLGLYGKGKGCTNLIPSNDSDTTYQQYLPSASGTLMLQPVTLFNNIDGATTGTLSESYKNFIELHITYEVGSSWDSVINTIILDISCTNSVGISEIFHTDANGNAEKISISAYVSIKNNNTEFYVDSVGPLALTNDLEDISSQFTAKVLKITGIR